MLQSCELPVVNPKNFCVFTLALSFNSISPPCLCSRRISLLHTTSRSLSHFCVTPSLAVRPPLVSLSPALSPNLSLRSRVLVSACRLSQLLSRFAASVPHVSRTVYSEHREKQREREVFVCGIHLGKVG